MVSTEVVAASAAVAALFLNLAIVFLTQWRRGRIRVTVPTQWYFGPDGGGETTKVTNEVFLYSTGARSRAIVTIWAEVAGICNDGTRRGPWMFDVWVHGNRDFMKRGSGLVVPPEGTTVTNHFLQKKGQEANLDTLVGVSFKMYARVPGRARPLHLISAELSVPEAFSWEEAMGRGIYWDLVPSTMEYHASLAAGSSIAHIPEQDLRF